MRAQSHAFAAWTLRALRTCSDGSKEEFHLWYSTPEDVRTDPRTRNRDPWSLPTSPCCGRGSVHRPLGPPPAPTHSRLVVSFTSTLLSLLNFSPQLGEHGVSVRLYFTLLSAAAKLLLLVSIVVRSLLPPGTTIILNSGPSSSNQPHPHHPPTPPVPPQFYAPSIFITAVMSFSPDAPELTGVQKLARPTLAALSETARSNATRARTRGYTLG